MITSRKQPFRPLKDLDKDDPERKKLEDLLNWLKREKVDCSKIEIMYRDEEYRALRAAKAIEKNEVIFDIP